MKLLFCSIFSFCFVLMVMSISSEYKHILLKAHNDLRREIALGRTASQPGAANMVEMVWDDELAQKADDWAEKCIAGHDTYDDRQLDKFMFVGQNMFAGPNVKDVVQGWYDEYKDYTFDGKSCSKVCGHYTQVAWAKSYAVGCSAVNCRKKTWGLFPYGWLFICNYGPAGNFNDEAPYVVGPPCSKCPSGTSCKNNLCALNDPTASLEFEEDKRHAGDYFKRHAGDYFKRHHQDHDHEHHHDNGHKHDHDISKRHPGDYFKRHAGDYFKRHAGDYFKRHAGDYFKRHPGDYFKRHAGDYFKRHHQDHDHEHHHADGHKHDYDISKRHPGDFFKRHDQGHDHGHHHDHDHD